MRYYGYKICYRRHGKRRWNIYLVIDRYDSALWNIRRYEKHSPPDRKTHEPLEQVDWNIFPIKSFLEYKWRWRKSPF